MDDPKSNIPFIAIRTNNANGKKLVYRVLNYEGNGRWNLLRPDGQQTVLHSNQLTFIS